MKVVTLDSTGKLVEAVVGVLSFSKSDGSASDIALTTDNALTFTKADGSASDIALVVP